ncbi:N-acetyltransferase [bacterium]|nr:N-acetyltransferase [bacterium]
MSRIIRTCTDQDIPVLTETVRSSFRDVAERFGLTLENAPRHPSNCTEDWIRTDMGRGVVFYAVEEHGLVLGCAALEQADPGICYLERLAVLPGHRRQGLGRALVDHVLAEAARPGVRHVRIGIIADHTELKQWYEGIGFVAGESREYPHLPFRVAFLSYNFDEFPKISKDNPDRRRGE